MFSDLERFKYWLKYVFNVLPKQLSIFILYCNIYVHNYISDTLQYPACMCPRCKGVVILNKHIYTHVYICIYIFWHLQFYQYNVIDNTHTDIWYKKERINTQILYHWRKVLLVRFKPPEFKEVMTRHRKLKKCLITLSIFILIVICVVAFNCINFSIFLSSSDGPYNIAYSQTQVRTYNTIPLIVHQMWKNNHIPKKMENTSAIMDPRN